MYSCGSTNMYLFCHNKIIHPRNGQKCVFLLKHWLVFGFSAGLPSTCWRLREEEEEEEVSAIPSHTSLSGSKCFSKKFWVFLSGINARCPPLFSHQSWAVWKESRWLTNAKQDLPKAVWSAGHEGATSTSFSAEAWPMDVHKISRCRITQHILSP